ncbi:MAG TPA: 3-dehydro-L-gulonate 2-dehydrogenase [Phycisphaerae bacterium]|nr:3-dehydro-L-gulonate 2-dehydrogenase [Phycisphaerae bacterium]
MPTLHIPYAQVTSLLTQILEQSTAMLPARAALCARLFADASRDGVPSHGLNRFALLLKWIHAGTVIPNAEPTRVAGIGGLERWDGNFGPGPSNAWHSMARAIELARTHGIGCVALRNTNHWMRAGNYGWQAADAGCFGICWTNTIALMPAWGGRTRTRRLGNSPLVMALPRQGGAHLVLDMAMSQYSMGKLSLFKQAGTQAPLPAGFDLAGNETRDPAAILAGGSGMPIGHWKGAGLAMLLDVFAASLAGGNATHQLRADNNERGVSQIFMAISANALDGAAELSRIVEAVVADVQSEGAAYPGQRSVAARRESEQAGVPVDEAVWNGILALRK